MQAASRLAEFVVESKLGEGSFSCVYKVKRIDDGKYYAMKKVKIGQMREKERENALNEVRILASISHPNIINYREAFFDDHTQTLCVVMELADAGDIQKKLNQHLKMGTHFNESQIWQALIQMAKGLKALHQINILHRDLKCANVFITSERVYKLGDLNVSKVAKRGMARTQTGTPYYTSPEVWNDRDYNAKCDVWSLGCVVYEMATLKPPFRASNLKELYTKIQKGYYEPLPRFYSDDLRTVITQCLKVIPSQRISAAELLLHPATQRNMPATEITGQSNSQTSKCCLLKTILVPKNLKGLKEALPGSKYQQNKSEQEVKFRRANSANNLCSQIPQVISSPKMGQNNSQLIRYGFIRPAQQPKKQIHSERQDDNIKVVPRMHRNNSIDYIRRRVDSNNSIDNSRRSRDSLKEAPKEVPREIPRPISRDSQKETPKEIPRPVSRDKKEIARPPSQELVRRNSRQMRQLPRSNSRDINAQQKYGSRQRVNSRDRSRDGREGMEEISNRCREIEERVRALIDKKKQQKEQLNPNLPNIKQPYIKYNYQRPVSRERELSRNKSIEIARQESSLSQKQQQASKKSFDRPPSRERIGSIERNHSKESERRRNGLFRYNI